MMEWKLNLRHDSTSLVDEIYVSNDKWCQTLPYSGGKTKQNSGDELTRIRLGDREPYQSGSIHGEGQNADGATAILKNQWHPDQVSHSLHQARSGDEVSGSRDLMEQMRARLPEKGFSHVQDGHGRTGREECAHKNDQHGKKCDIGSFGCRPTTILVSA